MKQKLLNILYGFFAFFARVYIKRTKPEIIWITWSVGKTSSRMIITQVLQKYLKSKKIYSSPKNYNSEIGLVLSIFEIEKYSPSVKNLLKLFFSLFWKSIFMKKKSDILVLEYWVDKPNDMDFLLKIAVPDYAVFTKLDYIHSANFSSKNAIWEEKIKLLKSAKKAVFINYLDDFAREYHFENKQKYFYNLEKLDYNYDLLDSKIVANMNLDWKKIQTNILWEENFVYIDLAFKILANVGETGLCSLQEKSFLELENLPWRFSIFEGEFDSILIDSSYNAGFESMKKMVENIISLQKNIYLDKKIIFVLWDMREAWENSEKIHRELFDFVKEKWEIISVWKETSTYFGKHLWNFKYARQAWEFLKNYIQKSEEKYLILFKWSQNTIFLEEAIKEVLRHKRDIKKLVRQEKYWKK